MNNPLIISDTKVVLSDLMGLHFEVIRGNAWHI